MKRKPRGKRKRKQENYAALGFAGGWVEVGSSSETLDTITRHAAGLVSFIRSGKGGYNRDYG